MNYMFMLRWHQAVNTIPLKFVEYLLDHLPVDEQIIADARCLNPTKQKNKHGVERVGMLASSLWSAVEEGYVKKAFNWKEFSKYVVVDEIKWQFKEYQTETIPEEFCKVCKSDKAKKKPGQSYWKQAYFQLQMPRKSAEEEQFLHFDDY